jgi:hypothetical protein
MNGYLGSFPVDISTHPEFMKYTPSDWVMHYIFLYGSIDGAHHKDWLLDQIARILNGGLPEVSLAKWDDRHRCQEEYRYGSVGKTPAYEAYVLKCQDPDDDGEPQYEYNEGIAP